MADDEPQGAEAIIVPAAPVGPLRLVLYTRPVFAVIEPKAGAADPMKSFAATLCVELFQDERRHYLAIDRDFRVWRFRVSHIEEITLNAEEVDIVTRCDHIMLETPLMAPIEETSIEAFARVIIPLLPPGAIVHGAYREAGLPNA